MLCRAGERNNRSVKTEKYITKETDATFELTSDCVQCKGNFFLVTHSYTETDRGALFYFLKRKSLTMYFVRQQKKKQFKKAPNAKHSEWNVH